jgi:dihydrofolate synthase/folylpolyglutamate synthase
MPSLPDALRRIYARIPLGMRLGLEPMREACARAGHPEASFPAVHVAGTNGKGSVCAMVEAIVRAQGKKTGLRIDGEPVSDEKLASLLERALDAGPDLSFFETATLAAFFAFRDEQVDLAVLEVGLGGRLDATNVIPRPLAAAITRIALDHTDRLGTTLVEIAREKAGIAKQGLTLLVGHLPSDVRVAIDEVAHAAGAITRSVDQESLPPRIALAGEHQHDNARIAVALATRIGASTGAIEEGLADVKWPGRLERIGKVLLDAAHNPDGAQSLAAHLRTLAVPPSDVALVFGTLADKDWGPMLDTLAPLAGQRHYVAPSGASRNAVDPVDMAARHPGTVSPSLPDTLASLAAVDSAPALVVVAGSLVLVGHARSLLLGIPRDPPVAL